MKITFVEIEILAKISVENFANGWNFYRISCK